MATSRIIILDRAGPRNFQAAYWYDVPVARQPFYANPTATSAYKLIDAGDLAAIRSGAVVEEVVAHNFGSTLSTAQVQTALENTWTAGQARITALNLWTEYGRRWDGTTWIAGGVS